MHIFGTSPFFFYLVSTLACTIYLPNTVARLDINVFNMSSTTVSSFDEIDSEAVGYPMVAMSALYSNDSLEGTPTLLYLCNYGATTIASLATDAGTMLPTCSSILEEENVTQFPLLGIIIVFMVFCK